MTAGPLLDRDPRQVGGHRILGRLGQGGQGVVYLAEGPGGEPVAVKMLRADLSGEEELEGFAREIELARRVKAFCTAQVLATGEEAGTPYVVSEFVDGPTLAQVIKERGAMRGAELRRVAIGTLTALAAIHQAGIVHRDFKPGNVLLGRDGPRVIDFGISRALDVAERTAEHLVGTPPFMAPEQFAGVPAGPPADLFAWASTVVCAGTGRPPFGTGEPAVVINRIITAEPVLGDLDGELRDLVLRCLDKDPATRPSATTALLTLLGHPVPEQRLLAAGQESAAPPARRRPVRTGAVAAVAAVLVAAGVVGAVLLRVPEEPLPQPVRRALPTPVGGLMALTSSSELKLPGMGITLHENPADPVWVSSYSDGRVSGSGSPAYVRDPRSRAFAFSGNAEQPVASPGGGFVAALNATLIADSPQTVNLTDRGTGEKVELRVSGKPDAAGDIRWDGDGRRFLLTVYDDALNDGEGTDGFVVVDPVTRTARTVRVPGGHESAYAWGPDGTTVLHRWGEDAVRVYDLNGKALRTFDGVGELITANATRSTAGTVFLTNCPAGVCLWDAATGERRAEVDVPEGAGVFGWLDDRHLMATVPRGRDTLVVMLDLRGGAVRTLADGPAAQFDEVTLWYTPR